MQNNSICRIGIFYDGTYFTHTQNYFYKKKTGWLSFQPFQALIENLIREKEQNFLTYRTVYAGWYQGLFTSKKATDHQLRIERNRHQDLMHAGIEPKYTPMSESQGEKGIDVTMAIDALQVGLENKIDIAALVTGDGDFVPLARALMKHGIRVAAIYFEYKGDNHVSFINERLLNICNYSQNINALEKDKRYSSLFKGLFRQPENENNL